MYAALHAPGNLPVLLACASHFSPLIEELPPDTVVFDIRGLRLIFGPPEEIAAEIDRRVGVHAHVALASNPDAAVHAARGIRGVTVIAPNREAETLAPLPLFLLGGSPEFARTMDRWGLRTFGQFAGLPPLGVAARLGEEGTFLQRLAQGQGSRLLKVRGEALRFHEERELECSVILLEPLILLLSGMIEGLCARLRSHSLAANEIRVWLKQERAGEHSVELRLPVSMLDPRVLLRLLELELSRRPPQRAIEKIRVELIAVEPRTMQHGLFLPATPEPEKLEVTLARIRNMVGAGNVGSPELVDTHRPDSSRMNALGDGCQDAVSIAPRLALRRFRPPCLAQVWFTEGSRPERVFSSKGEWRVHASAGPWLTSGGWWESSWDWEEWDIQVPEGVYRIHQDLCGRRWFVDGNYD